MRKLQVFREKVEARGVIKLIANIWADLVGYSSNKKIKRPFWIGKWKEIKKKVVITFSSKVIRAFFITIITMGNDKI